MTEPKPMSELHQKIDAGVKYAVAAAIEKHRRLGQSIVVWEDGKIVTLTADKISPRDIEKEFNRKVLWR